MPTVLSSSSTPPYWLRFHAPPLSDELAGAMLRAVASSRPMASSAAEVMFDVGALTTMTPAWVAAGTSTLSRPTPARAMTLSFLPAAIASASIWVAERISTASTSASAGQQLGAVRSVEVADLEVGAEGVDRRGRELLGDQDDGLGHVRVLSGGTSFGVCSEHGTASCREESRTGSPGTGPRPSPGTIVPHTGRERPRRTFTDATDRTPRWPSGTRSAARSRRRRRRRWPPAGSARRRAGIPRRRRRW